MTEFQQLQAMLKRAGVEFHVTAGRRGFSITIEAGSPDSKNRGQGDGCDFNFDPDGRLLDVYT